MIGQATSAKEEQNRSCPISRRRELQGKKSRLALVQAKGGKVQRGNCGRGVPK